MRVHTFEHTMLQTQCRRALAAVAVLAAVVAPVTAQPFQPGQGLTPLGDLRTSDRDGPYNLTLLDVQVNEVKAGAAARANFTDKDIIDFLVNVECLEGLFDTWGTFGRGFTGDLELGGPTPLGVRKANLTEKTLPFLQEVALQEQGHALLTRQAGGANPCPLMAPVAGFNDLLAVAYGLNGTVKEKYGEAFDPFRNDVNFVMSVLTLEELGATGNKGLAGVLINPVHANAVAGLATSATAQATLERKLLWELKDEIIHPFNETALKVFARISAYRNMMDGNNFVDQGLINTDPRFIAVPDSFVNMMPTDVRGLTFNRTPGQLLRILFIGAETKGGFFPNGVYGNINSTKGYNAVVSGTADWPKDASLAFQESIASLGMVPPPINATSPSTVPGEDQLTQSLGGPLTSVGPETRGLQPVPASGNVNDDGSAVAVGTPNGTIPSGYIPKPDTSGIRSASTAGKKYAGRKHNM